MNVMSTVRLSIGEVARRFGLRDSALRYYERQQLLSPPRDAAGQRYYRESELRQLTFVLMCRDGGLQLDEIAVMMGRGRRSKHRRWQEIVEDRLEVIEADIARLLQARDYLSNALHCVADHPAVECPYAQQELDDRVNRILA